MEMSSKEARDQALAFWNECLPVLESTDLSKDEKVKKIIELTQVKSVEELFPITYGLDVFAEGFSLMARVANRVMLNKIEKDPTEFFELAREVASHGKNDEELHQAINMTEDVYNLAKKYAR